MTSKALLIAVVLLAILAPKPAQSQELCGAYSGPAAPRGEGLRAPPRSDGPAEVRVGVFVKDLRDIDAVRSAFLFRGVITVSWCDPRLAFDAVAEGRSEKIYVGPEVDELTERIWWSEAFAVNQVDEPHITERAMRIRQDGTVSRDLNVSVRLSAQYDLRRFPFDRQRLMLEIESFTWSADELIFVADQSGTGFDPGFDMPEWELLGVSAFEERADVVRSTRPFSRLTLTIDIERKSGFYLWKVLLPLFLIVALSWSIFWMGDERFGMRVRMSATALLTVVAYQFVASQNLPRIGYLTIIDKITVISFVLLATTVLESYFVSRFTEKEDTDSALRIDKAARWIFPASYALLILGTVALVR